MRDAHVIMRPMLHILSAQLLDQAREQAVLIRASKAVDVEEEYATI
jgi:hypothetical protein